MDDGLVQLGTMLWREEDDAEVAAYLKAMAVPLDAATRAANAEKWWSPYLGSKDPWMWDLLLPYMGSERAVANCLCAGRRFG